MAKVNRYQELSNRRKEEIRILKRTIGDLKMKVTATRKEAERIGNERVEILRVDLTERYTTDLQAVKDRLDPLSEANLWEVAERGKVIEKVYRLICECRGLMDPKLFLKLKSIFKAYVERCNIIEDTDEPTSE